MPFTQHRQTVTDRVERQRPQLGLDPGGDQRGVNTGRQQMRPAAVGQRSGQVVEHELHRHGSGEWCIAERLAITQVQPG
ncbi:hypothetical protein D3C75_1179880 [compost metagenome]